MQDPEDRPRTGPATRWSEDPLASAVAWVTRSSSPTSANRPICPATARAERASFVEPTARIVGAAHVHLADGVYVGRTAVLLATRGAPVLIGEGSAVQDDVLLDARGGSGIEIGDRVVLATGASVVGTAEVGVSGGPLPDGLDLATRGTVHLGPGSWIDGAVLETDTAVGALGFLGPDVVLRSGTVVLPGRSVTTQAEADDPGLGKVRRLDRRDVDLAVEALTDTAALVRASTDLHRLRGTGWRGRREPREVVRGSTG